MNKQVLAAGMLLKAATLGLCSRKSCKGRVVVQVENENVDKTPPAQLI